MSERLEIYRIAVELAEKTSGRRAAANTFFLSLHSGILAYLTYVADHQSDTRGMPTMVCCLMAICLSLLWFSVIAAFRQINWAKFEVIHELEAGLEAQPLAREWELLTKQEQGAAHTALTAIERWIPVLFIVFYVALLIWLWQPSG